MPLNVQNRTPAANLLLESLPEHRRQGMLRGVVQVRLAPGQELNFTRADHEWIYFPIDCVVSFLYSTDDGRSVEAGLAGNEGIVGLVTLMGGGGFTASRSVVQIPGRAWKVKADVVRREFSSGGSLQQLFLRYLQVLLTQISQTAVCNRFHSVERRLCRRLLLWHDRMGSDHLMVTQEVLSNVLGGRRESVTVAARRLKNAGLIHYSRGRLEILSRQGLESAACECYRVVRDEEVRLLGKRYVDSVSSALKARTG
jgi:CRP-like cAMP-binding protein